MTMLSSRPDRSRARIALLIVLVAVATMALLRLRSPTAATVHSLATACRRDYRAARTAADSVVIDERVWQLDHGWRRLPSCGELRRSGTL